MLRIGLALMAAIVAGMGVAAAADGIPVGGQVLGTGGEPLAEARLLLFEWAGETERARRLMLDETPEPAARDLTDEDGRFRVVAPSAGLWTLVASAPGFASRELDLRPLVHARELPPVTLEPDVGLTVRVGGPEGAVDGATVVVRPDRTIFETAGWRGALRMTRTDETGAARLARGESERLAVSAGSAGTIEAERRGVRAGRVRLTLGAGSTRTVAVRAEDGSPVAGALLALGSRPHPIGVTDASGEATLTLPAEGTADLRLQAGPSRWLETGIAAGDEDRLLSVTLPGIRSVSGRVIDATTRRAIQGAIVWDRAGLGATTDRGGTFVLHGPDGQGLRVEAAAPGFLRGRAVEMRLGDGGRESTTFALSPAAYVGGRILDASGDPVAGAELTVARRLIPGRMEIEIGGGPELPRGLSDSRGRFRVGPIDPDGSWTLHASAEGHAPSETPIAGLDPRRASEPIEIRLEAGHTVSGQVADEDGHALREVAIRLSRASAPTGMMRILGGGDAPELPSARTDGDGRFSVRGIPDGTFDLTASRDGFADAAVPGIDVASADGPTDVGTVTLRPGERIEGYVTGPDGAPLGGVEVEVEAGGGGMEFVGFGGGPRSGDEPAAVSDPTGWFAVDDLAAGDRYTLTFRRNGYVNRSVRGLEPPGVEPLEVAMKAASAVRGVVTDADGEPVAGATVNLERSVTREMGGAVMQMVMVAGATADGEGRFEHEDQEPGTISLMGVAPGFRESTLTHLEVPEGEDLDGLKLELELGGTLEGRVLTPDGRPAIGARVRVVAEDDAVESGLRGASETDGDGRFRLEGLAPGVVSIEARHDDYPRRVREIEASVGVQRLDLQFEGGVRVSGRVIDETGRPVGGARVALVAAAHGWGGPETQSDPDGRFELPGVREGEYRVHVAAEGFAPTREEDALRVEDTPIDGLELSLRRGVTLVGSISGVEPELFPRISVRAEGAGWGGFEGAPVSFRGDYRIDHLAPGDYEVVARVADSGREASETLRVESGAGEVRLDLRFESALKLSGNATQGGEPIAGATIIAEGRDVDHTGWGDTSRDGHFSIEGLPPGRYEVKLREWQSGLAYNETVDLATSRRIELHVPTSRIVGRIVDAFDRQPLQGVALTLDAEDDADASRLPTHTAVTDQEGRFVVDAIGDGRWRLSATRSGYATENRAVPVEQGRATVSLDLELEPTDGLTLKVGTPGGGFPDQVRVAVVDASGYPVSHGNFATGENGKLRLSRVPAGDWRVALSAPGWATTNVDASAPGAAVGVTLEPATRAEIVVPELRGTNGVAWVSLADPSGRPYYALDWAGRPQARWRMTEGKMTFASLPPGRWTVRVDGPDGASRQGEVETGPGVPATLQLDG